MNYDAIVIGGGISGCAAAYYLASSGSTVALIEKDFPAAHASGFAFGSLYTRFHPPKDSDPIDWFRAESIDLHHQLAHTLPDLTGVDYQFEEKSGLVLAFNDDEVARLKPAGAAAFLRDEWPADRQDIRWLTYGELSHIDARVSTDVIGALYLGGMTEVSPGGLTNVLWSGAKRYGAVMVNVEVTEININNGAMLRVKTREGTISGGVVILAAGPWSRLLLKQSESTCHLNLPVAPLKGEILRYDLTHDPPIPVSLWWGSNYASSKPDGLLYVGSTHADAGFDEEPSELGREEIRRSAEQALPFLANKPIARQTACLRPMTPDGLPIVGEMPGTSRLVIATGGGPIGIELGPAIGKLAAEIAMGESRAGARYDMLRPDRFA